jgi:flagellar motor switch protein FliN/FliY
MPLDDNKKSQLTIIINKLIDKISTAAKQLLGSTASLELEAFSDSLTQTGTIDITEASVLLSSDLANGSLGKLLMIMNSTVAGSLAGQMMGAEALSELDNSAQEALTSLISQSFSSAVSESEALVAAGFSISDFSLTTLDPANPETLAIDTDKERVSLKVNLKLESGLNANLVVEFGSELVDVLLKGTKNDLGEEEVINLDKSSKIADTDFAEIKDRTNHAAIDEEKNLNLLMDIRMGMIVELGRAEMPLKDILKLTKGSIIELDRLSGEPVDLFVNNKLIARGEVVVIDDNFGLRITQLAGTKINTASELGLTAIAD